MEYTDKTPKYHLKIIVCGSGAVGKTSLIRRYVHDKFEFNYLMTIGMDPSNRLVEINDKLLVNLVIFDVAGQERFQMLRNIFFRKANAALLVFDLTRPETLDDLYEWKQQIDDRLGKDRIPNILIGNKSDLEDLVRVDYQSLEDKVLPDFKSIKYLETSAYLDHNVREAFTFITEDILIKQGALIKKGG
jgi:small GTP-binding protein